MTNEQALSRLIYELDDIARCDRRWFARRRLKLLKRKIAFAVSLASLPNTAEHCDLIIKHGRVLGWHS